MKTPINQFYEQMKSKSDKELLEIVKDQMETEVDHRIVQILDSLYIESRYPVDIGLLPNGKPSSEDAQKFIEFAILIYDYVKKSWEEQLKSNNSTIRNISRRVHRGTEFLLNCTASAFQAACCRVSERIKKWTEFLIVEDSPKYAKR